MLSPQFGAVQSSNPEDKNAAVEDNHAMMYLFDGAVSAAGIEYTPEGCSKFGCVVTGIPKDGFDKVVITITRDGLVILPDATLPYVNLEL